MTRTHAVASVSFDYEMTDAIAGPRRPLRCRADAGQV